MSMNPSLLKSENTAVGIDIIDCISGIPPMAPVMGETSMNPTPSWLF